MSVTILKGDCREVLRTLSDESVQCIVTSPPYWGLRDYGVSGQMGLEKSLAEHVDGMVGVFREARRVLRSDGTLWLNYGDSYATSPNGRSAAETKAAGNFKKVGSQDDRFGSHDKGAEIIFCDGKRNKRSVWEIATQPFPEAHFATFPPALIEPCIKAGCPRDGTVIDPFGGAGTTGLVADRLGRNAILIELNPEYAAMAERRLRDDAGMFANMQATLPAPKPEPQHPDWNSMWSRPFDYPERI